MTTIHIEDWSEPVEAGRRNVLDAALDAGVPYPHDCASGECGRCKSELLSGRVDRAPCSPDALSDEEAARGLFLACRSRPVGDIRVRWLHAADAPALVRAPATVLDVQRLAHDVVELRVELPARAPLDFRAGQSVTLHVGDLPGRSYSMANAPGCETLAFHVRQVPGGLVSGAITKLRRGERVALSGPHGQACWSAGDAERIVPARDLERIVLAAGGTGLAPLLSILTAALRDGVRGERVRIYHGVRTREDLYADDVLAQLAALHGFAYERVLSTEAADPEAKLRHGFLHRALEEDFDDMCGMRVYAAGPPPMVDAVRAVVRSRGLAQESFFADAFHAATPIELPARRRSLWARLRGVA
jgi:naphthalene 1,2-dioxygenase ferredoxin reductase component